MCDTIAAPPPSTAEGVMLFGKNSDRQRNEAQTVELFPAAEHTAGAAVSCTYISVPQVRYTYETLLCRPFWIWGAEMGANEHGVSIANEAVIARSPSPEEKALLGMDLLRLALERATTAAEAVEVITDLLERYGQGGNAGHIKPSIYNNSFMIADPGELFVLETVGRDWVLERACGVRAISNVYSIGRTVERTSAGLPAMVRSAGWSDDAQPDYASAIARPGREHIGNAMARQARATTLLRAADGHLHAADMMRIMRDHGCDGQDGRDRCDCAHWHTCEAQVYTICTHAGIEERHGQTTGSLLSELHPERAVHWVTATAAPCTAIFKPVFLGSALPAHGPRPTGQFDAQALWWRHERLHRRALFGDFARFVAAIRPERDALEAEFRNRIAEVLNGGTAADRARVVATCWKDAIAVEDRWYGSLAAAPLQPHLEAPLRTVSLSASASAGCSDAYTDAWLRMNELAGLDLRKEVAWS